MDFDFEIPKADPEKERRVVSIDRSRVARAIRYIEQGKLEDALKHLRAILKGRDT